MIMEITLSCACSFNILNVHETKQIERVNASINSRQLELFRYTDELFNNNKSTF